MTNTVSSGKEQLNIKLGMLTKQKAMLDSAKAQSDALESKLNEIGVKKENQTVVVNGKEQSLSKSITALANFKITEQPDKAQYITTSTDENGKEVENFNEKAYNAANEEFKQYTALKQEIEKQTKDLEQEKFNLDDLVKLAQETETKFTEQNAKTEQEKQNYDFSLSEYEQLESDLAKIELAENNKDVASKGDKEFSISSADIKALNKESTDAEYQVLDDELPIDDKDKKVSKRKADLSKVTSGLEESAVKGNAKDLAIFKAMDKDGNGVLDEEETANFKAQFDKNADGVGSKKEARKFIKENNLKDQDIKKKDVIKFLQNVEKNNENVQSTKLNDDGTVSITYKNGIKKVVNPDRSYQNVVTVNSGKDNETEITKAYDKNDVLLKERQSSKKADVETTYEKGKIPTRTTIHNKEEESLTEINYNNGKPATKKVTQGSTESNYEYVSDGSERLTKKIENKGDKVNEKVSEYTYNEDGSYLESIEEKGKDTVTENRYGANGHKINQQKFVGDKSYVANYDGNGNTNVVLQNRESIQDLAKKFGCSVEELKELNGKSTFNAGDIVKVPGEKESDVEGLQNRKSSDEAKAEHQKDVEIARQKAQEKADRIALQKAQRKAEDAQLKTLGMTSRKGAGEKVSAKVKSTGESLTLTKIGTAVNNRSICKDKKGNVYVVAHDGTVLKEDFATKNAMWTTGKKVSAKIKDKSGKLVDKQFVVVPGTAKDSHGRQIVVDQKGKTYYMSNGVIVSNEHVQKSNNADVMKGDKKTAAEATVNMLMSQLDSAQASFDAQMNRDGWAGDVADGVSKIWNNDLFMDEGEGNTASRVRSDLSKQRQVLSELKQAAQKGDMATFEKTFKKKFGVAFNQQAIANYYMNPSKANYVKAFGNSQTITDRVSKYNQSQETGATVVKTATEVTAGIAIGVTASAVTCGAAAMFAAGIGTAAADILVESTDRLSSNDGLKDGEFTDIAIDGAIDGGITIATMGAAKVGKAVYKVGKAVMATEKVVESGAKVASGMEKVAVKGATSAAANAERAVAKAESAIARVETTATKSEAAVQRAVTKAENAVAKAETAVTRAENAAAKAETVTEKAVVKSEAGARKVETGLTKAERTAERTAEKVEAQADRTIEKIEAKAEKVAEDVATKSSATISKTEEAVIDTIADVSVGAGAEYLQTGEVTIEGLAMNAAVGSIGIVGEKVGNKVKAHKAEIKDALQDSYNKVKNKVSDAVDDVKDKFKNAKESVKDSAEDIADNVTSKARAKSADAGSTTESKKASDAKTESKTESKKAETENKTENKAKAEAKEEAKAEQKAEAKAEQAEAKAEQKAEAKAEAKEAKSEKEIKEKIAKLEPQLKQLEKDAELASKVEDTFKDLLDGKELSASEMRSAYRKVSVLAHPDKQNGSKELCENIFKSAGNIKDSSTKIADIKSKLASATDVAEQNKLKTELRKQENNFSKAKAELKDAINNAETNYKKTKNEISKLKIDAEKAKNAEVKAKAEAEAKAKAEAEAKVKAEKEAKAKAESEAKAKAEAEAKAKAEAEAKAKAETEPKVETQSTYQKYKQEVKDAVSDAVDDVKEAVSDAVDSVKGKYYSAKEKVKDMFSAKAPEHPSSLGKDLSKYKYDKNKDYNSLSHTEFHAKNKDLFEGNKHFGCWTAHDPADRHHGSWKMHLFSVSESDWQKMSDTVIPYLREHDIDWKTFNSATTPENFSKNLNQAGKAFTIYPKDKEHFEQIARDLDFIIKNNDLQKQGTSINGDRALGDSGRIFYRYEFKTKAQMNDILDLSDRSQMENYHNNYYEANRGPSAPNGGYLAKDMKPSDDPFLNFNPSDPNSKPNANAGQATVSEDLKSIFSEKTVSKLQVAIPEGKKTYADKNGIRYIMANVNGEIKLIKKVKIPQSESMYSRGR